MIAKHLPLRGTARNTCLVLVALGAFGLLASGCSSSTHSGTIDGHLVVTGGAPQLPATRPMSGQVTATDTSGKSVSVSTDPSGVFALQLSPGTYTLIGKSPAFGSGKYPCQTRGGAVRVSSGHRTTVLVICSEY